MSLDFDEYFNSLTKLYITEPVFYPYRLLDNNPKIDTIYFTTEKIINTEIHKNNNFIDIRLERNGCFVTNFRVFSDEDVSMFLTNKTSIAEKYKIKMDENTKIPFLASGFSEHIVTFEFEKSPSEIKIVYDVYHTQPDIMRKIANYGKMVTTGSLIFQGGVASAKAII